MPETAAALGTSGTMGEGESEGESVHARAYREMGDPAELALLDTWFVVARRGGEATFEWISGLWNDCVNMNRQAPLPVGLSPEPAWVEVYVADDVAAAAEEVERLQLQLLISGDPIRESIGVKFNGIDLRDPRITVTSPPPRDPQIDGQGHWWTYALTPRHLAVGRNLLTMRCLSSGTAEEPVVLEKVEVHVAYRCGTARGISHP